MFTTYFTGLQVIFFCITFLFFVLSLITYQKGNKTWAVFFLFMGALSIYTCATLLDPFLNVWDERFHALVAKNLINHPLKPTLYDSLPITADYSGWDKAHIWLHKQPLFLWQMALSMKLFGANEVALRLPSAIMCALLVPMAYRMGKCLVNDRVGYITALLFFSSFYLIELVSGRGMLEHNDVAFLFYVTASFWAWIEFIRSKKKYWIIAIGVAVGAAILCKWLVGLSVFMGWGMYILLKESKQFSAYLYLFSALVIALIIALPWQFLTFAWYPQEAAHEMAYNSKHFFEVIEGHDGEFLYHIYRMKEMFINHALYLVIPGFFFLYRKMENKALFFGLLTICLGVELFFAFAQTKMPSFTLILAFPFFVAIASFFNGVLDVVERKVNSKIIFVSIFSVGLSFLVFFRIDLDELQAKHTLWKSENVYTKYMMENRAIYFDLRDSLDEQTVIFNVGGRHYVECMFYTQNIAYSFVPSKEQYLELKAKGLKVALMLTPGLEIPTYLKEDQNTVYITQRLQGLY